MSIISLVTLCAAESRADDITKMWEEVGALLHGLPGFKGATLSRARSAEPGQVRFINIGQWASEEDWRSALGDGAIGMASLPDWIEVHSELLDNAVSIQHESPKTGRINNLAEMAYPGGRIVAHLEEPALIEAAISALEEADIDLQDIAAFHGEDALSAMKLLGGKTQNIFSRMMFRARQSSKEGQAFNHTLDTLQAGGAFITVKCEDREAALRVRGLLAAAGGKQMHYFAQWTVETFTNRA